MTANKEIAYLQWDFSPSDFFKELLRIDIAGYVGKIVDSKILIEFDSPDQFGSKGFHKRFHKLLENYFKVQQLFTQNKYELSNPTLYKISKSGRVHETVLLEAIATIKISVVEPTIIVKDQNGNVISNSKLERIQEQERIKSLIQKHGDDLYLQRLLSSALEAQQDPQNAFVHYYEMRDILETHLGGKENAIKTLDIKGAWEKLGRLANGEPINSGRHTGNFEPLRDATDIELQQGRIIAEIFIKHYLDYLEKTS